MAVLLPRWVCSVEWYLTKLDIDKVFQNITNVYFLWEEKSKSMWNSVLLRTACGLFEVYSLLSLKEHPNWFLMKLAMHALRYIKNILNFNNSTHTFAVWVKENWAVRMCSQLLCWHLKWRKGSLLFPLFSTLRMPETSAEGAYSPLNALAKQKLAFLHASEHTESGE